MLLRLAERKSFAFGDNVRSAALNFFYHSECILTLKLPNAKCTIDKSSIDLTGLRSQRRDI